MRPTKFHKRRIYSRYLAPANFVRIETKDTLLLNAVQQAAHEAGVNAIGCPPARPIIYLVMASANKLRYYLASPDIVEKAKQALIVAVPPPLVLNIEPPQQIAVVFVRMD